MQWSWIKTARRTLWVCFASFGLALPAQAAIWEATESWNETWEDRFSEWVIEEWSKDYFTDQNRPLTFGLELDCADAVYAMRILFAYEHGLPFAINDPRRSGRKITHEMTRWDDYRPTLVADYEDGTKETYLGDPFDDVQKLRAFIDFVSEVTSTESLAQDTYPIALAEIAPGDMFLVPGSHAYMVSRIEDSGAMTTLSASSPKAWRAFAEIRDFPAHVPTDQRRKRDGYRRFKPIEALTTRPTRVDGASTEQWDIAASVEKDAAAFGLLTQSALAQTQEPLASKVDRALYTLCDYLGQRVEIVQNARDFLHRLESDHQRQCMNIYEYNEYSTPSRDARLMGQYRSLRALMALPEWEVDSFYYKAAVEAIFEPADKPVDLASIQEICRIDIDFQTGRWMDLRGVWLALEHELLADDPHAPLEYRWGIAEGAWEPRCDIAKPE